MLTALIVNEGFTLVKMATCPSCVRAFAVRRSENGCRPTLGRVSYTRPLNEKYTRSIREEETGVGIIILFVARGSLT